MISDMNHKSIMKQIKWYERQFNTQSTIEHIEKCKDKMKCLVNQLNNLPFNPRQSKCNSCRGPMCAVDYKLNKEGQKIPAIMRCLYCRQHF